MPYFVFSLWIMGWSQPLKGIFQKTFEAASGVNYESLIFRGFDPKLCSYFFTIDRKFYFLRERGLIMRLGVKNSHGAAIYGCEKHSRRSSMNRVQFLSKFLVHRNKRAAKICKNFFELRIMIIFLFVKNSNSSWRWIFQTGPFDRNMNVLLVIPGIGL